LKTIQNKFNKAIYTNQWHKEQERPRPKTKINEYAKIGNRR
jgi:hypothetical protein